MSLKKIIAICGSTRKNSTNLLLIRGISSLSKAHLVIEVYHSLDELPHFNPDLEQTGVPPAVAELRNRIRAADGVLICTPEYVFSLPGSLKNALEWMVSSSTFSGKPVALVTASGLGEKAHESLLLIMKTLEAKMSGRSQLLIQGVSSKVSSEGEITDKQTLEAVNALISAFRELLNDQ